MSDTGDIKKGLPAWAQFVFGILIPLVGGAVAYGELTARNKALEDRVSDVRNVLEQRVDRVERDSVDDRRELRALLAEVKQDVGGLKIDIARVCVRLKCKE